MKTLTALVLLVLSSAPAWSQKQCTRVTATSQNCLATLAWTGSVVDSTHSAPTDYIVRRSDGGAGMVEIGKVAASVTTFQNTFTDAGNTAHCYDVLASNAAGVSPPSNQACWTTGAINPAPPNAPSGVTLSAISSSALRMTWDDVDWEANYEVYGRTTKGPKKFSKLSTLPPDTVTYDWTGRKAYTSYCLGVLAVNDAGSGPMSETRCATTSK